MPKLCQVFGVKGVVKSTFNAWSNTLNECALCAGSVPVGFVNGDPTIQETSNSVFRVQEINTHPIESQKHENHHSAL